MIGLVVLALVDVALVAYLFLVHTNEPLPVESDPVAETDSSETDSADDGSAGSSSAGAEDTAAPSSGEPVWYTLSDGALYRASRGDCAEADARLERWTADGGRFDEVTLPTEDAAGLTTVLAVETNAEGELLVVATGADCDVQGFRSDDEGRTWDATDQRPLWFVGPDEELVGPRGAIDPGCPVQEAFPLDPLGVRVLCVDGSIRGTDDGGDSWVVLGVLTDAHDVVLAGLGSGLGLAETDGCPVRAVTTQDAGGSWEDADCVADEPAEAQLVGSPDEAIAVLDGEPWRSTDVGATWQRAG